jgi:hypothetical protein
MRLTSANSDTRLNLKLTLVKEAHGDPEIRPWTGGLGSWTSSNARFLHLLWSER